MAVFILALVIILTFFLILAMAFMVAHITFRHILTNSLLLFL